MVTRPKASEMTTCLGIGHRHRILSSWYWVSTWSLAVLSLRATYLRLLGFVV